ncbi:MAG: DUF6088 family protein [Endomicrobium sp.]|jgi:hypothetical protein|uniref:DUF6088 family protein n=1 Tax=Candidatus Endomicrobiellum cubanum TaxID=3242325 RepID=UPI00281B58E2|nr:DUF6088 family protein [Endomicrobium sp.]
MTYTDIVEDYIAKIDANTPIFLRDVKEVVSGNAKMIMTRMMRNGQLVRKGRGIYCKPKQTIWGTSCLGNDEIIKIKYLQDANGNIQGYITGCKLFNRLGLTTQVPRNTEIVTNVCKGKNKRLTEYGVIIKHPKIEVDTNNYLYQQLLDVIENKENIQVEVDNPARAIYGYFTTNSLDFAMLYTIAKKRNASKRTIEKMSDMLLVRS